MIGFFNESCFILVKHYEIDNFISNQYYKIEKEYITLFCEAFILKNNKIKKVKGKIKIDFEKLLISPMIDEDKFLNSYIYDDDKFIFFNFLISKENFECKIFDTKLESIDRANEFIEERVKDPKLLVAFTELFLNAYEHGNLGLSFEEKSNLMREGKYIEYLKNHKTDKKIIICFSSFVYKSQKIDAIKIVDEGEGFEVIEKQGLFNGRGIKLSSKYAYIFYNQKGNEVLIIKEVDGY